MATIVFWYRAEVEQAAKAHGLDPDLVHALCLIESTGYTHAYKFEKDFWGDYLKDNPLYCRLNPQRVSASYGLMQVMFPTAVDHGLMKVTDDPEELFVPKRGLDVGCGVLASNLKWAGGDVRAALAAYNGGKRGNQPGQPGGALRNADYANKVTARLAQLTAARNA